LSTPSEIAAAVARGVHLSCLMNPFARSCLTSLTALSLCWWTAGEAAAQPSAPGDAAALTPEGPPPTFGAPGQTMSCEGCYQPRYAQPYYYPPQLQPPQLTSEEWNLLDEGEIGQGRHFAGFLLSLSPGFGLGQAVQGRWSERGWIFTFGEAAGIALAVYGANYVEHPCDTPDMEARGTTAHLSAPSPCGGGLDRDTLWMVYAGLGTYAVLHLWEIVDSLSGPVEHNRQVRALRRRAGLSGQVVVAPFLVPSHEGGAMAGLSARF
jgi:hypothetical protein